MSVEKKDTLKEINSSEEWKTYDEVEKIFDEKIKSMSIGEWNRISSGGLIHSASGLIEKKFSAAEVREKFFDLKPLKNKDQRYNYMCYSPEFIDLVERYILGEAMIFNKLFSKEYWQEYISQRNSEQSNQHSPDH